MTFLLVSSMLFSFTTTVMLLYNTGKKRDNIMRRMQGMANRRNLIDEELSLPFAKRFFLPAVFGIVRFFSRLLPKSDRESSSLEKKMKMAGIKMSLNDFAASRLMFMTGAAGTTATLVLLLKMENTVKFFILLFGIIAAISAPNLYLSSRIKKRQGLIKNQTPDVMDLLTVCVEAGLGFDAALLKINERFKGPLVDELMIVQREIQMALPRRDALMKFTERNNIDELKVFAGAVIQADQMGLPMKNVLRVQSSQLRLARKQAAEEKAMKAPIKMMLPLIVFVFPVIFIILLGPTVLQIIRTFAG